VIFRKTKRELLSFRPNRLVVANLKGMRESKYIKTS